MTRSPHDPLCAPFAVLANVPFALRATTCPACLLPPCPMPLHACLVGAQVTGVSPVEVLLVETEADALLLGIVDSFHGHAPRLLGVATQAQDSAAGGGGMQQSKFAAWLSDTLRSSGSSAVLEATAPSGAPAISLDPSDSSRVRFDMGHPLMRELSELRRAAPEVAATVAAQLFDSARAAAGVLPDSRVMLPRFVPLLRP